MNDTELHHLLHAADRPASPTAPPAVLAERVRRRSRRAKQKRLAAVPIGLALLAGGVWFARPTAPSIVRQDSPAAPPMLTSQTIATLSIDDEIHLTGLCIHRLQQVERLTRIVARRAAVRDPIAVLDEQQANALLDRANNLPAGVYPDKQHMLALIVQQFPDTLTAAVARRQIQDLQ